MDPATELKVDAEGANTSEESGSVGDDGWIGWIWRLLWYLMMWQFSGSTESRGGSISFVAAQRTKMSLLHDWRDSGVEESSSKLASKAFIAVRQLTRRFLVSDDDISIVTLDRRGGMKMIF